MSTTIYAEPMVVESPLSPKLAARATVSVVIPCYNEEKFIGTALDNLAEQYWSEGYEIIVVDGMSNDGTRKVVAEFQRAHPDLSVSLLDNPARNIPHALNLGIAAARGEIIARMDAHAVPSAGYIRRCVEVLRESEAAIVGMPCRVRPADGTRAARAIALGVSHPFGIGDAKYRLGNDDGRMAQEEVDTVAFACFRKLLWTELSGFDEKLLTNEDYDFNYRARARGKRVVLDRQAHCDYFARATLGRLASQYARYGMWKARMIRQRPRSLKLRQLVAPVFALSIAALATVGFWGPRAWQALALELLTYLAAAVVFGYRVSRKNQESFSVMLTMPAVFLVIHLSWGASFLWGLVTPRQQKDNE
ncbi:MAG TPA: glycosyltransferase family 2 protein [Pyrinomonadaceae bacterium]|nr:glycosyltransferase family 2 protein [Pyrinomonadaceae bacterium]